MPFLTTATTIPTTIVERRRYESEIRGMSTLRHRPLRGSSRVPSDATYTTESNKSSTVSCRDNEFRSPNQEFIEYLLCFILQKIALLFYMIYTAIDSILHSLSLIFAVRGNKIEEKSRYRSRTFTEDTVSSISTMLLESPKSWCQEEMKENCDEWGHFTFIE